MKKCILLVGMLVVGLVNAQTGKVGINTKNPNETLEINGTLRVDNLPVYKEGKIYDGAETTETIFGGQNMVTADDKGNVGKALFPFGEVLVGGDGVDAIDTVSAKTSDFTNPNSITHAVKSGSFTLTKKSLVFFNVAISTSVAHTQTGTNAAGTTSGIYGPQTKRYGYQFKINGEAVIISMIPLTQSDILQLNYTSSQVTGQFVATGSRTMVMDPGTYTYELDYRFQKHSTDTNVYTLNIANGPTDTLDIIAIPLEF